jgi:hypothetical protein
MRRKNERMRRKNKTGRDNVVIVWLLGVQYNYEYYA